MITNYKKICENNGNINKTNIEDIKAIKNCIKNKSYTIRNDWNRHKQ